MQIMKKGIALALCVLLVVGLLPGFTAGAVTMPETNEAAQIVSPGGTVAENNDGVSISKVLTPTENKITLTSL